MKMNPVVDRFTDATLSEMRQNHTYRTMRLMESPEASRVSIRDAKDGTSREQILQAHP